MLGFLKRLFSKEPEVPIEEVELVNLHSWFDEKTKSNLESLNTELKEVGQRVSSEVQQAKQNLDLLNKAELLNQNIPERAKHFMEGNRSSYTKKINLFIRYILIFFKILVQSLDKGGK